MSQQDLTTDLSIIFTEIGTVIDSRADKEDCVHIAFQVTAGGIEVQPNSPQEIKDAVSAAGVKQDLHVLSFGNGPVDRPDGNQESVSYVRAMKLGRS